MATLTSTDLPVLDSSSPAPNLFDGTPRLYINVSCPYAQRTWIARNYKGLENIELVAINLKDKPKWYLEKVYPAGKVPSLEHDGKVKGESLDLLEYIDKHFGQPVLFPEDNAKEEARKELWKFSDEFNSSFYQAFRNKDTDKLFAEKNFGPLLDRLENALSKFENEGPFFLGKISAVDFAYAPFVERFELLSRDLFNYEIFEGRPKLAKWFEAINAIDAYKTTRQDPKILTETLKKYLGR